MTKEQFSALWSADSWEEKKLWSLPHGAPGGEGAPHQLQ